MLLLAIRCLLTPDKKFMNKKAEDS